MHILNDGSVGIALPMIQIPIAVLVLVLGLFTAAGYTAARGMYKDTAEMWRSLYQKLRGDFDSPCTTPHLPMHMSTCTRNYPNGSAYFHLSAVVSHARSEDGGYEQRWDCPECGLMWVERCSREHRSIEDK